MQKKENRCAMVTSVHMHSRKINRDCAQLIHIELNSFENIAHSF